MKNNSDLFFLCSLIEYIARQTKNRRSVVVNHCEPIEKVADDFMQKDAISEGNYDNLSKCKYIIPDYWDIGEVFARLIEDCYEEENIIKGIKEVYASWIAEKILNFNSDLYYQSREYLAVCYKEGKLLLA